MLKEDIEHIVNLIAKRTSMKRSEILDLIEKKVKEFEGLIDEYAAALMVAKELGVHVLEKRRTLAAPLKIKDLVHGLRNVTIYARVLNVMPVKKYTVNGKEVSVAKVMLVDETGIVPLALWNEKVKLVEKLKPNSLVKVTRAVVRKFKGSLELSLTSNSEVELVDEKEIELPSISELTPQDYKGESLIVRVERALKSLVYSRRLEKQRNVLCIRGYDMRENRRVRIVAWDSLAELFGNVEIGDIIKITNAKLLNVDDEFCEYLLTKWSTLDKVDKSHVEIEGGVKAPSSVSNHIKSIDIEGYIGYLEPRGIYTSRLMLHDFCNAVFINLSSSLTSQLLLHISNWCSTDINKIFEHKVRIEDVDVIEVDSLPILKTNPWSSISLAEETPKFQWTRKLFIKDLKEAFTIRATVLKANLKIAVYDLAKRVFKRSLERESQLGNYVPIGSLRLILEDGIDQALALTNSWRVISNLFNINQEETTELALTPEVLKEVIEYAREELEGREYLFSGFVASSKGDSKILIIVDVEPINLSYEIKLLEDYARSLEEVKSYGKEEKR